MQASFRAGWRDPRFRDEARPGIQEFQGSGFALPQNDDREHLHFLTTSNSGHSLRLSFRSDNPETENKKPETVILMPESFRDFEHAGWEGIPGQYHKTFGDLTSQAITSLLDAADVKQGDKFLDIASGPGYVAAAAAKRGAVVLGVDFSAAMIVHARQLHPGVKFREGDAEHLSVGNGLFDGAAMNFGILHLAKPEQALAEAFRVLRAGGHFAFSAWAKPEETIGFGIVLRAVAAFGEPRVRLPEGPPFFRFSDPEECIRGLSCAGFAAPAVTKVAQTWRLPPGDGLFDAMKDSTVRTAGLLRAQQPAILDKIRDAIRAELAHYTKGGIVELPMPALIASGVKPK
jgi:SAM-dependent methyltransferase